MVRCASAGWVKRRGTTSVGIPHKGRNGRPSRQKQLDGGGRRRVQARGVPTVYTKVTNGRLVSRFSLGVRSGGQWRCSTPPTTLVAGVTYLGRVAAPWLRHGRRASKWSVENGFQAASRVCQDLYSDAPPCQGRRPAPAHSTGSLTDRGRWICRREGLPS